MNKCIKNLTFFFFVTKKEAKKFWGGIFASAYGICDGFDFGAQMSLLKQAKPHGGKLYFKSINFL